MRKCSLPENVLFLLEMTAVATAVVDGEAASVAERFDCRLL